MLTDLSTLPTSVPGFADYGPKEQILFNSWKVTLEKTYRLHGFNPLELSPFIRKEFLEAKGGINHQIFAVSKLNNNQETAYGLAFDHTVPLALWVKGHEKELIMPYKRYDISLSFRGEKPSMGRFHGFYQCDVDIIGRNLSNKNEVQCISALVAGLQALLKERRFSLYLNDIKIPKALLKKAQVSEEKMQQVLSVIDKMEKAGIEETRRELTNYIPSSLIDDLMTVFSYKGPIEEFSVPNDFPKKALESLKTLKETTQSLHAHGVPALFCPGMVRGLNYYTGIVFETFLKDLPAAGSVMSGGRYDELVAVFEKKPSRIEGIGGSIGLTRLFDLLLKAHLITPCQKTACKVMILTRSGAQNHPWGVARALRKEGIACDVYTGNQTSISKQLKYTDRNGVPIAVMVMESSTYSVKKLLPKEEKAQSEDIFDLKSLVKQVKQYLT